MKVQSTTRPESSLVFHQLVSAAEIRGRIAEVGRELERQYGGEELVIVMIMKGAICLVADLIREIRLRCSLEVVQCQSYVGRERRSLTVRGVEAIEAEGRHLLVVDDIFDSGETLSTVVGQLALRQPKSLKSLVLLRKRVVPTTDYRPDYVLFEIEDRFVVGYGLDYNEQHRGMPGIYELM